MKSIKTKLILLIGILLLVVSSGLGIISYIMASNALVSNISKTLPQIATQAANTVQASLDGQLSSMETIAVRNDMSNISASLDSKMNMLQEEVKRSRSIKMGYADMDGNVQYTDGQKENVRDKEFFKKAMSGEKSIADPVVDKNKNSMTISYAVPIKNNNSVVAVLVSVRDGMELTEMIKKITFGKTGSGFMINSEATSIAFVDKSLPLSEYNGIKEAEKNLNLKGLADVERKMIVGETGIGKYNFSGRGETYAGYAPVKKENWSIAVLIGKEELLSELNSLKIFILSSSLLFLLLGLCTIYIIAHRIAGSIKFSSSFLKILSTGDFTKQIPKKYLHFKDETGDMANSMNIMQQSVSHMLETFKENSQSIDTESSTLSVVSQKMAYSSNNVSDTIQEIANGISNQAGDLINITNGLNMFSNQLQNIVDDIRNINLNTLEMNNVANDSNSNMGLLVESVNSISSSFENFSGKILTFGNDIKEVNKIIGLINNIADKTNLLALNASIEATAAGNAGRGFTVVADEIRKLAEQTKDSSKNITQLIGKISNGTGAVIVNSNNMKEEFSVQMNVINKTINSFDKMIAVINEVIPKIQSVNSAAANINEDKGIILKKVESVSSIAQEISASSEEITASAEEMSSLSEKVASTSVILNDMTKQMMLEVNKFEN
jgi:methyl-accepting chemotaxis protein